MKAEYKKVKLGQILTHKQLNSISRRLSEIIIENDFLDPNNFYEDQQLDKNIKELEWLRKIIQSSMNMIRKRKLGFRVVQGGAK